MGSQEKHTSRILVVDDEPTVASTLSEMFHREGYAVTTVGDGDEAVSALKEHTYDVVVTDLVMERKDGLHVIRTVSRLAPETIVIVLTGHGTMDTAVEAMRLGAYDYLLKPCKNAYLLATVRKGLEKRRLRHQLRLRTEQLEQSTAELSSKTLQLSALHQVSTKLQTFHDEDELLRQVASDIRLHFGFESVRVGSLCEDGQYIEWKAVAEGGEILGRDVLNMEPTSVQDIQGEIHTSSQISQSFYVDHNTGQKGRGSSRSEGGKDIRKGIEADGNDHRLLYIPLSTVDEHMLGLLVVNISENGFSPTVETVEILETFALTAGAALERVRTEKRLTNIFELSKEMTSATDAGEIINLVVQAMGNILEFDHCSVNMFDENRRTLTTVACIGFPEKELGRRFPVDHEEGVCTWVAKTGEVANIPDVRQDPRYVAGALTTRSELAVPIQMKNKVFGILNVESDGVGAFSDKDVRPLLALASHAAIALEYKHLEEKLTALSALNKEMSLARSLDELLDVVLDGAQKILNFDQCALMLIDEVKNELYVEKTRGFQKEVENLRLRIIGEQGITTHVARTGQALYVPDISQEARYVQVCEGTQSEMAVPLKVTEKVFGVFNVESSEKNAFDENDYRLCIILGAQAAAAIESTRVLEEMQKTKAYLENLVKSSVDAIITTDVKGIITFFSKGAENTFGYTPQESLRWPISTLFVGGKDEADRIMGMLREKGKIQNYETRCNAKGGHTIDISLSASLLKDERGEVVGLVGISKDITEVKTLERQMAEAKNYLENFIERSQDAIFAIDLEGKITMWNSGAERLYGHSKDEAIGRFGDALLDPQGHTRKTTNIVNQVRMRGSLIDEEVLRIRKDGKTIPVTATFSPITDSDGRMTGISVIDKDISQRKRLEKELRNSNRKLMELSILDDLTKVFNRRYFNHKLEEEIKRSKRFGRSLAFVMIDIDHFKAYNDTYGHPKGDEVLRTLAQILVFNCREVDMVARYGGEEFCILLPETPRSEAIGQAERIRELVEYYPFHGVELLPDGRLTISLGVSVYPDDAKSKDEIVESADRALYWAKASGRNQVKVYSPSCEIEIARANGQSE